MRPRDESKESLIRQKAVQQIVNKGIEGFSMKDLARACRLSVSTIYVYFKNKDDLLFKLILRLRTEHLSYSIRGLHEEMSLEEGLLLQWQNRLDYFKAHPLDVPAVDRLKYTPQFQKTNVHIIKAFQPHLGRFVDNARKNGELANMSFEMYWALCFAPLYALIEFHSANASYAHDKFSLTAELITDAVKRIAGAMK